jgi:hypothetical protein
MTFVLRVRRRANQITGFCASWPMANAVSSYKTIFGCDYHHLTGSTLQDARVAKTGKEMMPLVMDDGHFAEFVKNNYNIDAEPTKTADQEFKEDLS